jgi:type II secretory pathway pseudopilin PulG
MRLSRKEKFSIQAITLPAPSRLRRGGFTLSEMMIVVGLLVLFAAASIVTLMVTNHSAMATRNKTLVRAQMTERMNELMAQKDIEEVTDDPITLWQIDEDGENVQIDGTLTVAFAEDRAGIDTNKVIVTVKYNWAGREIEHELQTIKNLYDL